MAHSLSAKKRIRQSAKRRARNRFRKETLKDSVKTFVSALTSGDLSKATEEMKKAASRIDKIASKGTIHKNTAARKRSRLQKRLNALAKTGGKTAEQREAAAKSAGKGKKAKAKTSS